MEKKLLFLHIPKTAGSTFNSILYGIYPSNKRFHISGGSAIPSNYQYEAAILNFKRLDKKIVDKVELLYGHMPVVLGDEKNAQFRFVTFLRNPIERVISDFSYVTSSPENPLHLLVNDMSIKEYVSRHKDLQLDNLQTRLICGNMNGTISEEDVEAAKANIDNLFAFVGFTEHFDESLVLLKNEIGWKDYPVYQSTNITRKKRTDLTEDELATIRKYNKYDLILYDYCLKSFLVLKENNKEIIQEALGKIKVINKKGNSASIFGKLKKAKSAIVSKIKLSI